MWRIPFAVMILLACAVASSADEPTTRLDVWPAAAPGETGDIGPEKLIAGKGRPDPIHRMHNVSRPTLSVFKPPRKGDTGAAVVVCPGGGYNILAWDLEGTEVVSWLNSIGVTGVLLKYRVPRRKGRPRHEAPLQDAQRTISLVRGHAEEWGVDPNRIGILGFSAGGHLSATASTNFDRRAYDMLDRFDRVSCRPDFAVLIYPAYLSANRKLMPEIRVSTDSPPMFFAHASNDRIGPENSIDLFLALKQAGVEGELHVYEKGGHGFGLRPSEFPCSTWPASCEKWLRGRGLLKWK